MIREVIILLTAVSLCSWAAVGAQRTFKWIDAQGNVSYHDYPPPANSGYRVEEKRVGPKRDNSEETALEELVKKNPVVLYSVPKCALCDMARVHLQKRGVSFAEKNVEKDPKLQEELKKKVGSLTVPAISIGDKVLNTYADGWLDSELDLVGYPKNGTGKQIEITDKPPEEQRNLAPTQ